MFSWWEIPSFSFKWFHCCWHKRNFVIKYFRNRGRRYCIS